MPIRSLLVSLVCCLAVPSAALAAAGDPVLDVEERALCRQINSYRAQNAIAPLKMSVALTTASKWMSTDMSTKNYFSHTDSLGRSFSMRLTAFGYASGSRAENIAAGSPGAIATFNQWKNSAGHNRKMLDANYKVIGIGRAYRATSTYKWYWTTDFGSITDRTMAC